VTPKQYRKEALTYPCALWPGTGFMEVAAVSLTSWERQILSRIAEELSGADSKLSSLVTAFNRLVAGEAMPSRPQIAGLRRSRPRGGYRRRRNPSRTWRWLTAAWFLTTAALIAVADPAPTGSVRKRGRQAASVTDWVPSRSCRPD